MARVVAAGTALSHWRTRPVMRCGGSAMRTIRLSLVGTVILSLLGGLGAAAVVAQSDEGSVEGPSPATHVTGTRAFTEFSEGLTDATEGDLEESYDWRADYVMEMSDPRVTGTLTLLGDYVEMQETGPRDSAVGQGPVRLVNDGGTWSGTWSRAAHPPCGVHTYVWLFGEEAYEGLTFWSMQCSHQEESTGEIPIEGVIF